MTKLRQLLAGVAIAALAASAHAQPISQQTLTGSECWNAGQGPGGPTVGFICGGLMGSVQTSGTSTGASSFTIPLWQATTILTAQPAVSTITLPANPSNGMIVEIVNGTTSAFVGNVVTIAPNTGQTLLGGNITITTLAAHASVEFRYNLANTTWYQVR